MSVLYSIAIIAFVGIIVCCVSYTSDTVSTDSPQQSTHTAKPKQALKKKICAGCDEKQERLKKMMREWLNEKPQEKPSNKEVSAPVADPELTQIVR